MQENRKIKDIYACKCIKADEKTLYPLQTWYNQLIEKRMSEIEMPDILRMIRQEEFIDVAIFKAIDYLKENPFAGDMYDGELLEKLLSINIESLVGHIDDIKDILSTAFVDNQNYEWLDEEERKEFAQIIIDFETKISSLNLEK